MQVCLTKENDLGASTYTFSKRMLTKIGYGKNFIGKLQVLIHSGLIGLHKPLTKCQTVLHVLATELN